VLLPFQVVLLVLAYLERPEQLDQPLVVQVRRLFELLALFAVLPL
jgi:hypothetical protein